MNKEIKKTPNFLDNMSTLKKILIVFVTLIVFIIIVEQPGNNESKQKKNAKFFIPKMIIDEVEKIGIQKPNKKEIILEKRNGKWEVNDGGYFLADKKRMEDFLKKINELKENELTSKNPNRMSIYAIDKKTGVNIRIWNNKKKKIADFFAGKYDEKGQFIRHNNSNSVFYSNISLASFLFDGANSWKDKVILSLDKYNVTKINLKNTGKELALEMYTADEWNVIKPKKYKANKSDMNNLFVQLKKLEATSFANTDESKKANFKQPDYQLSLTLADKSIQTVSFSIKDKDKKEYYAKSNKSDLIYIISKNLIDKIFGLKFEELKLKSEET